MFRFLVRNRIDRDSRTMFNSIGTILLNIVVQLSVSVCMIGCCVSQDKQELHVNYCGSEIFFRNSNGDTASYEHPTDWQVF